MTKKQGIRYAIATAFLAATAVSGVASAVDEVENNNTIQSAQRLTIGQDGSVTVKGVLGVLTGTAISDVDIYSFYAYKGNVLDIDIDYGIKMFGSPGRSVDTTLTVLGPKVGFSSNDLVLRENFDSDLGLQFDYPESLKIKDPYISKFLVAVSGVHYVAVTGYPRRLGDGGTIIDWTGVTPQNGDYTLIISGVIPSVMQINIEIKPGSGEVAPINPKSRGSIPVALLSSDKFDALKVAPSSLTFGRTGDERSWQRCAKDGSDVNGDGLLDLVCHFENQAAKFDPSSVEGVLKGSTTDGTLFEGRSILKVIPVQSSED